MLPNSVDLRNRDGLEHTQAIVPVKSETVTAVGLGSPQAQDGGINKFAHLWSSALTLNPTSKTPVIDEDVRQ